MINIKPVEYQWKGDDEFDTGFAAQEVGTLIPNATFSVSPAVQNTITCYAGGTEMLRVAEDGFYVRGVKVEQDDKEAKIVYNAFKQFLVWSEMNRR